MLFRSCGPMDKASDYESGDSRFESWQDRKFCRLDFHATTRTKQHEGESTFVKRSPLGSSLVSSCGSMDKAFSYETRDSRFKTWKGLKFLPTKNNAKSTMGLQCGFHAALTDGIAMEMHITLLLFMKSFVRKNGNGQTFAIRSTPFTRNMTWP